MVQRLVGLALVLLVLMGCSGGSSDPVKDLGSEVVAPRSPAESPGPEAPKVAPSEIPVDAPEPERPVAAEPQWVPTSPKEPGLYLFAVDLGSGEAESLLVRQDVPELLGAASADGRYLLLLTEAELDPPYGAMGQWVILDRETDRVIPGPAGATGRAVGWSGRGFWVDQLTHLDLQGQVESYEGLRRQLMLERSQIVGSAWQADGSHVVLVILPEGAQLADLVWASAAGSTVERVSSVVQPWYGKTGFWTDLALSPDGALLYLRGVAPGRALIRTDRLTFDQWQSLGDGWTTPKLNNEGGGMPPTSWSPDGSLLLEWGQRLYDRTGALLWSADSWGGHNLWAPDGTGFIWTAGVGEAGQWFSLDGQSKSLGFAISGQVLGWLPDGRLLVAQVVYEP